MYVLYMALSTVEGRQTLPWFRYIYFENEKRLETSYYLIQCQTQRRDSKDKFNQKSHFNWKKHQKCGF